jgi:hypothetical protein
MIKIIIIILLTDLMISTGYNIIKVIPHKKELLFSLTLISICTAIDTMFYICAENLFSQIFSKQIISLPFTVLAFSFIVLLNLLPWRTKNVKAIVSKNSMMCAKIAGVMLSAVALYFLSADFQSFVLKATEWLLGKYFSVLLIGHLIVTALLLIPIYFLFVDTTIERIIAAAKKLNQVQKVISTYSAGKVVVNINEDIDDPAELIKYNVLTRKKSGISQIDDKTTATGEMIFHISSEHYELLKKEQLS